MSYIQMPPGRAYASAVPKRMLVVGNSISRDDGPYGASTTAQMYISLLRSRYNPQTYVNTAVVGSVLNGELNISNTQLAMSAQDVVVGCLLFNDMRSLGPNPQFLGEYHIGLEGMLTWLGVVETSKIRAINRGTTTVNPAIVRTGTWAYFAVSAGTDLNQLALRSSTGGATATFPPVIGDVVYVWYFRSTLSEQFRVSIDGNNFNVGGAVSYTSFLGGQNSWELCCLRVSGLSPGPHTVVVTQVSDPATVAGVAGMVTNPNFGPLTTGDCPALVIGNCLKMISGTSAQGYAFAGSTANDPLSQNGSIVLSAGTVTNAPFFYGHAGVNAFNAMFDRSIKSLQADGLRIVGLDIDQKFMPGMMVSGDFVHPNDTGHLMMFEENRRALDPLFQMQ